MRAGSALLPSGKGVYAWETCALLSHLKVVSPHSGVGVASPTTENKYTLSQTTDISNRPDESAPSPRVSHVSLAWAAWQTTLAVSHDPLSRCFSATAHKMSVKCKHVRAEGWEVTGRLMKWAAERPSVCVCVLCLSSGPLGRAPHHLNPPSSCLVTPQKPASQMWSHSLWQPRIPPAHHGDPHSRNAAAPTFPFAETEPRCKQAARCRTSFRFLGR